MFESYHPLIFSAILVTALLVSAGLTGILRKIGIHYQIMDVPTSRSSHERPTPRGGGMAVAVTYFLFTGAFLAGGLLPPDKVGGLLITGCAITLLGFIDDLITLPRNPRVIVWLVITGLAVLLGISLEAIELPVLGTVQFGIFSPLVTFLWLIGVTNFYNFMDGIDGLAASETILTAGFLLFFSFRAGNDVIAFSSLVLLGAAGGFLIYNFPPAKIFMGDGGSNFLGFMFAALAVLGGKAESNQIPFVIPVILLNMFLLDGSVTLIKRLPKGKNWLEPHRDHYYQRLIKSGLSHLQVTLLYSSMNIILGGVAYVYLVAANDLLRAGLLVLSAVPFLFVVIITHRREQRVSIS